VLMRLPHELKQLFREWLELHFPERAAHVMSLMQQMHGGKDYDWERTTAEPYMHYVLALAGRGAAHKARILRLIEESPNEPRHEQREQLYMLKAALFLAGDHRYERDLRSPDVSPLDRFRENSWTFYSDLRMRGFMLSIFGDLFGRDPGGEKLAELVAQGLQGKSDDYTTQELAWGITGLGKRLVASAADFAPPSLQADGRKLAPAPLPPGVKTSDRSWDLPRASEYEHLTVNVPRTVWKLPPCGWKWLSCGLR